MAYEQRDNSGTLFKNPKKEEGDKRPNAIGDAMIGGVMYRVSAWTRDGAKGKFQSLSFEPKDATPTPAPRKSEYKDRKTSDFGDMD